MSDQKLNDDGKLLEANVTFSMVFQAALQGGKSDWLTRVATETTSKGAVQKYPINGTLPRMREWLGERQYERLARYAYSLVNRKFEQSVEIDMDDFEDEQMGGYEMLIAEMGRQAEEWKADLVLDALAAGETRTCYDDTPFFSGSHPIPGGGGTFANLVTGMPLTQANFETAMTSTMLVVGRDGRTMSFRNGTPLLVVPAQLRSAALSIVAVQKLASGADNPNYKAADLLVLPDLGVRGGTSASDWYLLDVNGAVKPLILQLRMAPELRVPKLDDASVVEKDTLRYTSKARGEAGYGVPQTAFKFKAA